MHDSGRRARLHARARSVVRRSMTQVIAALERRVGQGRLYRFARARAVRPDRLHRSVDPEQPESLGRIVP
jgi:hypothetical protein